jgi:hypothetical protein
MNKVKTRNKITTPSEQFQKSNRKIVRTETRSLSITHMHDLLLS